MNGLITYLAEKLSWRIDLDDFEDIEDIAYDFEAEDIGLKEEAFVKIRSLRQLPPLVDGQKWGIFCVEFDSKRFEVTALRKILSGLIPKRRNSADHAVWDQKDLLFICFWGSNNERTIGLAHFEDVGSGLPQIKMISCCPAVEDFTQIKVFEDRLKNLKWPANYVDHKRWQEEWSNAFTTGYRQTIHDASTLTTQLAIEAQGIKNRILENLEVETSNGYVHLLYEKFRNTLIHDMTETQFADMYAQTVVYGLFSARCMDGTQDDFSATEAVECIPNTNPFLKSFMKECLGSQNNSKLSFDELEIGNVVELLLHTKTEAIIQDFNRQTGGGREDPVIHFYEEFLAAYDKEQKVQKGVFYTPQPIVNFIVRAVDCIIKSEFGRKDGLASTETKKIKYFRESKKRVNGFYRMQVEDTMEVPAIQVLDPSTGTGTFLRQTILQIYEEFKTNNAGKNPAELRKAWNEYVPANLLTRLNAFELMMAPYAVAHMKLAMVLKDTGYEFDSDERLHVYLTNSLEEPGNSDGQMTLWDDPLATESIAANAVKKNTGINILIGNPPYNGYSVNASPWIMNLMEDYKKEPGTTTPLQERNSKFVNDDYIRFLRYAQDIMERSDEGIIAYINPHGFLDAPTFRGVRWKLLSEFDKIYVVNLHGNTNRGEKAPDGSVDENVFDIQQGVSINVFVKGNRKARGLAKVYYTDIYGKRIDKYAWLNTKQISDVDWVLVEPKAPFYLMIPRDDTLLAQYMEGVKVSELFKTSVMGFQTHRDKFAVAFSEQEITERAIDMKSDDLSDDAVQSKYSLKETRDWKINSARQRIKGQIIQQYITPCTYRPFDVRYTYLDYSFMDFPRRELMENVLHKKNICLLIPRQQAKEGFRHVLLTEYPADSCAVSTASREGNQIFPLYSYENSMFNDFVGKRSNLCEGKVNELISKTGLQLGIDDDEGHASPQSIVYYIYSVLHSSKYRESFSNFIMTDFPYITKPINKEFFCEMVKLGERLAKYHTLSFGNDELKGISLKGSGAGIIESVKYSDGQVRINKAQSFSYVPEDVWNYQIGGHQPAHLWLKQRKGRILTQNDILIYCKIITAIEQSIQVVQEIDASM